MARMVPSFGKKTQVHLDRTMELELLETNAQLDTVPTIGDLWIPKFYSKGWIEYEIQL
jgi:hypothetical protein